MTRATRWPETRVTRGLAASPLLASEAGVAVLRAGGNAVDAATAAAATIAVVYPHMNGVGGDNFWLIYDAAHQRLVGLNAAGRSAAAADLASYRSRFGDVHVLVEATKLALEDRERYLADPAVVPVPVDRCLDPARLAERRGHISRRAARSTDGPGVEGDTVAVVAADAEAGDTGVLLQNRGPSSLSILRTPTVWPLASDPATPSSRRCTWWAADRFWSTGRWVAKVSRKLTLIVDRGLGPQAAVEAPRWLFGRTWGEASRTLRLESRFEPAVGDSLRRRVTTCAWWTRGATS